MRIGFFYICIEKGFDLGQEGFLTLTLMSRMNGLMIWICTGRASICTSARNSLEPREKALFRTWTHQGQSRRGEIQAPRLQPCDVRVGSAAAARELTVRSRDQGEGPQRPHKHKDPTFVFEGSGRMGSQKPWVCRILMFLWFFRTQMIPLLLGCCLANLERGPHIRGPILRLPKNSLSRPHHQHPPMYLY